MFNKVLQICLVITSLSPVLFTFWFKEFSKDFNLVDGIFYLIGGIVLLVILKLILCIAKKKLEVWSGSSIEITEISNADNQSIVFIFVYLIPLLEIDTHMLLFLLILSSVIIYSTNIYHFNPMLGILGYHQYEVKLKNRLTMILITKKTLVNSKQIKEVVQLTDYIILEKGESDECILRYFK